MTKIEYIKYLEPFMHIYMCELEMYLKSHRDELLEISFQSDEANTDRPLKEYLKKTIEQNCNHIEALSAVKKVSFTSCWYEINDTIRNICIQQVLLPDELTDDIKAILKSRKKGVFTNPDLCLVLNIDGDIVYETVELKSTKLDAIPGSSVQQVSPYEWVIFIQHKTQNVDIATGRYMNAVNTRMQFPDRSPRPQVSFSELKKWNLKNRIIETNDICINSSDNKDKQRLLEDWQGVLAERWINIVFSSKKTKTEPWFNNNLRKFVLKFLDIYDELPHFKKEEYKELLHSLIE